MVVVCAGLVLLVVAFSSAATPSRCCFDKQYSVTMGSVGEILTDDPNNVFFLDGVLHMGFDFYTDRQGMFSTFKMPDGSSGTRLVVKDYAARRAYTRINNGTCTYSDIPAFDVMRPACIPDNATYIGPSTIGYGHHSMNIDTWSFSYMMDATKPSQLILSVTQDHCVPVVESLIGVYYTVPMEQTFFFVDYHPGLENLENLQIPANCQPAPTPTRRQ